MRGREEPMRTKVACALMMGVTVVSGCTAGVGTHLSESIRPAGHRVIAELALLPVTAELGSEDPP